MAVYYVRSTDGNNADSGATWALAKATVAGALAVAAAGDTIYVSQVHAETQGSAMTWTSAGTAASPINIICANDGAEPPTAVATTGTVTTTGAFSITVAGSLYAYGLTLSAGTGATGSTAFIILSSTAGSFEVWENCNFILGTTSTAQRLTATPTGALSTATTCWKDCSVKFTSSGHFIDPGRGRFEWAVGSLLSGGTSPTVLFSAIDTAGTRTPSIFGLDLVNASSSVNLFGVVSGFDTTVFNWKLPASWSGSLVSGTQTPGQRYRMHNCDSADTNYRLWEEDVYGSVKSETTLVKSSGASDGTTGYSWKLVSSSSATYPCGLLESPSLPAIWNATTGSSRTVTVDILHDSATNLTDAEIWLEVQYLGTSGFPLSTIVADAKTDVLATAADQTSSSATWTTTGMANPNKQKLAVTFTPQEAGFFQARVMLAKASKTVYVDPVQQVT